MDNVQEFLNRVKEQLNPISVNNNRYDIFNQYIENVDFDDLIYRIILEHNTEYCDKFYHNGKEPELNNKLKFFLNYVVDRCHPIEAKRFRSKYDFLVWKFNNYFIQILIKDGGVICGIFTSKYKKIFQQ
jgi:hypothetical protein